jgi:hypothetical protein
VHGSNARIAMHALYGYLYLKLAKFYVFLIIAYVFSIKIGKEGRKDSAWKQGGWGERDGGREEKWPKQCMHI